MPAPHSRGPLFDILFDPSADGGAGRHITNWTREMGSGSVFGKICAILASQPPRLVPLAAMRLTSAGLRVLRVSVVKLRLLKPRASVPFYRILCGFALNGIPLNPVSSRLFPLNFLRSAPKSIPQIRSNPVRLWRFPPGFYPSTFDI